MLALLSNQLQIQGFLPYPSRFSGVLDGLKEHRKVLSSFLQDMIKDMDEQPMKRYQGKF